jgi:hypothetical protein
MSQHHQNKPAPAPDELEAPEVVAVLYKSGDVLTAEECGIALEVCAKVETPLMTVAQHNRIVASLTRPAQTEQQPAYVECRECTDCGHVGINDAHQTDATCAMCDWSGPSPVEDQCPDCGKENVMGAACPKCSGRYRILAETHVAAPIAQTVQQPEQSGLVEALEAIVRQYPNSDISHVDYRVHACRQAEQALDAYRAALPNHRGGA